MSKSTTNATPSFDHSQAETLGILVTNLGTPDAPTKTAVRRYLKQFLSDTRVIKTSKWLWWPILNLIILNTRPKRSAAAYAKVWTDDGSPLLHITQQQADALQQAFDDDEGHVQVQMAMRYGSPSIDNGLAALRGQGAQRILVLPLYPQYSATTIASTFDEVARCLQTSNWLPELRFVNHYHDHPAYIAALASSVQAHWKNQGQSEKLLLSFHGIPHEYFTDGDPYHCECQKTGRLLAEALGLNDDQWLLTFQSRLGPKKWLQPYTDKTLQALAKDGTKSLDILCPGFSADCLETLEEMAIENKHTFLKAGGEQYHYIPCLNDSPDHIAMLKGLAQQHMQGWPSEPTDETELAARAQRAAQLDA